MNPRTVKNNSDIYGLHGIVPNSFYSVSLISKVERKNHFWEILEAYHLQDSRGEHRIINQYRFVRQLKLSYAAINNNFQTFVAYNYKDLFLTQFTC